jgi:LCP family protein required for cell wall assembly
MMRRDRPRQHATPSARTRRIREAAAREEALRARGTDPEAPPLAASGEATFAREPRRIPVLRYLLLAVLLALVVAVIGGVLLWQRISQFNDSVSSASATSFDLLGPLGGDERVNIALFGYGGPEHKGGSYLADSIQILSIDPQTDTTTLIPIPRDFWVEGLPEIPDNGKINEAFAIGELRGGIDEAGRFTTSVLSKVTGLKIEHWLAIDFTGFREVVDAVGGVTIVNPTAFSYTWSEDSWRAGNWTGGHFDAGTLHLDGTLALDYSRSRYTSVPAESSDFARSVRQQRVLAALRSKIGSGGLGSLGPGLAMMDALDGRMRTDLSALDLFLLSGHLGIDRRLEMKEGEQLLATTNTIGQYILIPIGQTSSTDYEPIKAWLRTELAKPIATPAPSAAGTP